MSSLKADDAPLFPISLYVYNDQGMYGEPIIIESDKQLHGIGIKFIVRESVKRGVKVIMTDPMDRCLFHAEGGVILFPTREDVAHATPEDE